MSKAFIVAGVLCVSGAMRGFAQAERAISARQWQQLTSDKAFDYRSLKEAVKQPKHQEPGLVNQMIQGLFGLFGAFGSVLLWLFVIGVAGYVIYRLFISKDNFLFGRQGKQLGEQAAGEEDEIGGTNWEALLQQAVSDNNIPLAVRYSYMWLLQILQSRELISYRVDKTNYDYYTELADTKYKQSFKQLSRQYEYAWYGKYTLTKEAYNTYIDQFNALKKQLGA